MSLVVEPGQTMVLVGATGAGKTTLLQLVPRLADVTSGAVLLDGTDVRRLPLPVLRSRVGCAFEDPTLFSASVRENVAYGVPDADDAAIEAALAMAQAGFVHDLPWGLDTRIGEQGMALSGGQRQRVALARAILARPSLLILDDPLSALDVHTEAKVTQALRGLLAETTALVVAHRPSTVLLADKVALLRDGVIAATGTHAAPAGQPAPLPGADERPRRPRHRRAGGIMTTGTWRGIAAEDVDEVTGGLAALLRRRARRLLFSLLRPQSARVAVTFALIVTANLAALAGPWLVGVAIDRGIPPLLHGGDLAPLALYVAGFAAAVVLQAVASRGFIYSMGQLGETVVLELRQRLFLHFQRLPVSFHEHYTSGRVISRQVSDIDSISDLFDDGLDALVSAALSLILVGGRDAAAGLAARAGGAGRLRAAGLADVLVPARVRDRLPADAGDDRPGHRPLRGNVRRYPRGTGVPQGAAQRGDLRQPQRRLRGGQPAFFPGAGDILRPGSPWSATWRPGSCCSTAACG